MKHTCMDGFLLIKNPTMFAADPFFLSFRLTAYAFMEQTLPIPTAIIRMRTTDFIEDESDYADEEPDETDVITI